jgi:hypothetical protein
MRPDPAETSLVSGDLQVFRWLRRMSETLRFVWTPGKPVNPRLDGFVGVVGFENQPKLGPAVLPDCPIDLSFTTSVAQFRRNSAPEMLTPSTSLT